MIDFIRLKNILQENNSFLLTTHVNPDADAIGSEIALYKILKQNGKKVFIINHSSTPYNLKFLDEENKIERYDSVIHKKLFTDCDVLVALDFNRADRMVSMQKEFQKSDKMKICIDHHQDAEKFVNHLFVDVKYAATAQIFYDLIKRTNIAMLTKEIAQPVYASIMTDTGSFRFDRTTPGLHRIIADLLERGVDPGEVYSKLYDESKPSKLKLLGKAIDSIKFTANGKIGYMVLTQKNFSELKAQESDTENFVNYTLSVENVILGLLFIELKNGFKVSFRSKGNLPVNKIAAEFGGGGHLNAAGARFFNEKLKDKMNEILLTAESYLQKYLKDENV